MKMITTNWRYIIVVHTSFGKHYTLVWSPDEANVYFVGTVETMKF